MVRSALTAFTRHRHTLIRYMEFSRMSDTTKVIDLTSEHKKSFWDITPKYNGTVLDMTPEHNSTFWIMTAEQNSTVCDIATDQNSMVWESENITTSTLAPFQPTGLMTAEQAETVRFIALQIILPIICIVGLPGNLMSVGAMFNTKDHKAFISYLKTLTLSDSFTLICGLTRFLCDVISEHVPDITSELRANSELYLGLLGTFSWNFSSYLITVMSLERSVAVVFPFQMKRFAFDKHPKVVISVIFALQIVFRTPSWIWLEVVETHNNQTNTTHHYVHYRTWAQNLPVRNYISLALVIFDMFVPIVIVLLANIVIVIMIKRRNQAPVGENNAIHHTRILEHRKITITLMILSAFYLLSIAPNTTIYVIMQVMPDFAAMRLREINLMNTVSNISVLMICLNSANDFVIYTLSSRHLRKMILTRYFSFCLKERGTERSTDEEEQRNRREPTSTDQTGAMCIFYNTI